MANITIPILVKTTTAPITGDGGARDLAMLETMQRMTARPERTRKNLTTVALPPAVSRNTRVAFVLAPEWGPYIAPYNLARLAALTKASGYATRCFDINIAAYH